MYWLARMLEGGEDPKFIARRMVIFASEDVGNAEPMAVVVATSIFHAVEVIGLPEAQINLAQGTTYLASCPKSNASYAGLIEARKDAKALGNLPVPSAFTERRDVADEGPGLWERVSLRPS